MAMVASSVVAGAAGTAAVGAKDAAAAIAHEQKTRLDRMRAEWQAAIEAWIKRKALKTLSKVVERVPQIVKDALEDPDMPRCASRGKDRAVDATWPDVRVELMWELAVLLDGERPEYTVVERPGVDCFRAFFRYHLYPYNKTLWGKLRDPIWVLFSLVSLVPLSGLCSGIFLFIFILIDKTDSFQLCSFILQFKGTQFISHGIIRSIMGFFIFMNCVTVDGRGDEHHCEREGPGIAGHYEVTVGGFLVQVVLVWVAFTLLSCSREKGRSSLKGALDIEEKADPNKSRSAGGYLRYLLFYDLFCFLLSASLVVAMMASRPEDDYDEWTVKQFVFAAQVLYGFLSMPFFLFTIPLFQIVLTHTVPTAYDEHGRCRSFGTPPAIEQRREEKQAETRGIVESADADRLLEKIRGAILGEAPEQCDA